MTVMLILGMFWLLCFSNANSIVSSSLSYPSNYPKQQNLRPNRIARRGLSPRGDIGPPPPRLQTSDSEPQAQTNKPLGGARLLTPSSPRLPLMFPQLAGFRPPKIISTLPLLSPLQLGGLPPTSQYLSHLDRFNQIGGSRTPQQFIRGHSALANGGPEGPTLSQIIAARRKPIAGQSAVIRSSKKTPDLAGSVTEGRKRKSENTVLLPTRKSSRLMQKAQERSLFPIETPINTAESKKHAGKASNVPSKQSSEETRPASRKEERPSPIRTSPRRSS